MFGFWKFLFDSIKVECLAIQFVILSTAKNPSRCSEQRLEALHFVQGDK
ncbi:unnamed protein product [marine sediment metagenome]|uniref:Uncharacterized protein n=1 Tax=marine sediment metagenome TaxID=412755 RepID=X1UI65_9ZZZZ